MHLTIESLPAQGVPEQLILLLHGQGADGAQMAPLAQALRRQFAQAAVLAPDAPLAAAGGGRCWYTDAAPAPALAALRHWVQAQQQRLGVSAPATALGGFGQGATLALALAMQHDGIAGRVLAFGADCAALAVTAPRLSTLHLFHGEADAWAPVAGARTLLQQLGELQGDATLDTAAGVGATLHPALLDCALRRLQTHIPLRTWQAALGAVPPRPT